MDLSNRTVTTEVTRIIIDYLRNAGVALDALPQAVGLAAEDFTSLDGQVPVSAELRLWDWAAREAGNPDLGLSLANRVDMRKLGVVGYLSLQQPDLFHMLETFSRYHRLLHGVAVLRPYQTPAEEGIEHFFTPDGGGPGRQASEFTIGSAWMVLRGVVENPLPLRGVDFQHTKPAHNVPYGEIFGAGVPVRFNQPRNRLRMPPGSLRTPLREVDTHLAAVLRAHAEQALAALPSSPGLEASIGQLLPSLLSQGEAEVGRVAASLGMSQRTLQRRLQDAGISFREIVEKIRRELALQYLSDLELNISQICFLLGFSEPAAFSRAFARWTGQSPRAYRSAMPPP